MKPKIDVTSDGPDRAETLDGVSGVASHAETTTVTVESLCVELKARIFGYLSWKGILLARACRSFRDAAARALVPFAGTDAFRVYSFRNYEILMGLRQALPNLQQIRFTTEAGMDFAFEDGEDPDPNITDNPFLRPRRSVDAIAAFRNLRSLGFTNVHLNGGYPGLFRFPHLQKLVLVEVEGLKLDLETIARGLPALECLKCYRLPFLWGSMRSLGLLRDTIREIFISYCPGVDGNLMDLAAFPLLEMLLLDGGTISGDVRHIGENDFPALRELALPHSVYGSSFSPVGRIADAPELMNALCRLKKRNGTIIENDYGWKLAADSPDRYPIRGLSLNEPPFTIELVACGQCIGWRWTNYRGDCCKATWLDQEPDEDSDGYIEYLEELSDSPFERFVSPPTEDEYQLVSNLRCRTCDNMAQLALVQNEVEQLAVQQRAVQ